MFCFQSNDGSLEDDKSVGLKKLARFMEPKLQDSFPSKGCSPQGLVAIMFPKVFATLLSRLTASKKIMPGSPFRHAP